LGRRHPGEENKSRRREKRDQRRPYAPRFNRKAKVGTRYRTSNQKPRSILRKRKRPGVRSQTDTNKNKSGRKVKRNHVVDMKSRGGGKKNATLEELMQPLVIMGRHKKKGRSKSDKKN